MKCPACKRSHCDKDESGRHIFGVGLCQNCQNGIRAPFIKRNIMHGTEQMIQDFEIIKDLHRIAAQELSILHLEHAELRSAAQYLCNEITDLLGYEGNIRALIGNTNTAVIIKRLKECQALLTPTRD